jgi:C4-dicarboxylate-specific signal transduction histidine kinase
VGGFGLGLPLARDIARWFGGDIRLVCDDSAKVRGATFALRLPAYRG